MQQHHIARDVLGNVTFETGTKAADALEDGSLFAIRINEQTKHVTFFYLNGNEPHEETQRLHYVHLLGPALRAENRSEHSSGQKEFVACGDVFIRPGMVAHFRPAAERVNVVHWNQSHHPYSSDLTFTLLGGKAEMVIRGIQNGVARPFNQAGYHVIPRGMAKPFFIVQKAEDGVKPLLFDHPERPGRNRIPLGSGAEVPRQYVCV